MKITRRAFVQSSAAGAATLAVAVYLPELLSSASATNFAPNAYIEIGADNSVVLWVTRSEMGQGVRTVLPMMLAEELEVDLDKVRLMQAMMSPRFKGIRLRTSGSGSSSGTWTALRKAGATAREMLISAAAKRWGVDGSQCHAESGAVIHTSTKRRLTYGELVEAAAKMPAPSDPPLKDPKDFKIVGQRRLRLDGHDIVHGTARYGLDVEVPGMLIAVLARSPRLGGSVKTYDASKALQIKGVRHVVPVKSGIATGVAVVADNTWAAMKGCDALEVTWDPGPNHDFDSDAFIQKLIDGGKESGFFVRREGDAPAALGAAPHKLEATYEFPFQAHAPVEPMNCIADVRGDGCEIRVPTQAPEAAQEAAAKLLGVPKEKVIVNVSLLGGGFGRRLFVDYVPEAVEISRAIKKPVKVIWTRQDDMKHGYFQPASVEHMSAAWDSDKKSISWIHKSVGSDLSVYPPSPEELKNVNRYAEDATPWGAFDTPYHFANLKVDYVPVDSPVPSGPWRAVEYPARVFARESFMDELAHALKRDPIELRIALLQPGDVQKMAWETVDRGRMIRVLEATREKSDWGKPLPAANGRRWGRGLACSLYHGESYMVQVATVSVDQHNNVQVHKICCVVDCGLVLNPAGIEGQTESGITWGLSATLRGKIDFRQGAAQQGTYNDFRVIRMNEAPVIELHTIPSVKDPGGYGEHSVPPVAPAVANAVFAATGKRVRQLPITAEKLA